jgi:hypothetical protein
MVRGKSAEQVQIARKLDRMEQALDEIREVNKELLKRMEDLEFESYYPPENKIKKSYIKKMEKIDSELKSGKYHTYKNIQELDRAIRKTR